LSSNDPVYLYLFIIAQTIILFETVASKMYPRIFFTYTATFLIRIFHERPLFKCMSYGISTQPVVLLYISRCLILFKLILYIFRAVVIYPLGFF